MLSGVLRSLWLWHANAWQGSAWSHVTLWSLTWWSWRTLWAGSFLWWREAWDSCSGVQTQVRGDRVIHRSSDAWCKRLALFWLDRTSKIKTICLPKLYVKQNDYGHFTWQSDHFFLSKCVFFFFFWPKLIPVIKISLGD